MYLNSIPTVHRRWRRSNALALIFALIAGAGALWLGPSPAHAANPATVMATTQRMTAATLQADQHGTYAAGRQLTLVCHARGQSVQGYYSPWVGWDNLWYQASDGFWVADVDINTGSNDPIVSACPTINTSSWYLLTAKHSGKAIDVRGAGRVNGTAVQQYTTNRSAAQYFRFAASGSGFYQVVNQLTNTQVWDAAGAGTANGTKIVTYGWAGGRNQQWRPVWDSSHSVTFQPRHAVTKCLDVPGGSTADSVQLQLWDCNGTAAQKFAMSSGTVVAPVAPGDDYPYKNAVSCGTSAWCISGVATSAWGFYYRNCTDFVAWRMNNNNKIGFTNGMGGGRWGNANNWDDNARKLGYAVNSTPARGAIAQTDAGGYGHVAWVESVNANGTVTIQEYNVVVNGVPNGSWRRQTVATSTFNYIHVKDLG